MFIFCIGFQNKLNLRMCQNIVPAFLMRDYQESVTTGQTHRRTDGRIDRRRTNRSLCAAMLRRRHTKEIKIQIK